MAKRATRATKPASQKLSATHQRHADLAVLSAYVDLAVAIVALEEAVTAALKAYRVPRGAIGRLQLKGGRRNADD